MSPLGTAVCLAVLIAVLGFAVARPRGLPEVAAALPGGALLIGLGLVPWPDAWQELTKLAPTVAFLAAVLALAHLADTWQVFAYAGSVAAGWSRHSSRRLLTVVFLIASTTTAVLSLDATVVLLTPVVFATAAVIGARPRPHVYACAHLANSASLLLPVSNLTNLLAFAASGLSFTGFAGLMALPWLVSIAVEYAVFRRFFATDLAAPAGYDAAPPQHPPRFALGVLGLTLVGFAVSGPLHLNPAWSALAGSVALAMPLLWRTRRGQRWRRAGRFAAQANPAFCGFVLALGVIVAGIRASAVGNLIKALVPTQTSFLALLGMAALAAVLANLLNNLPATLVLVPLAAHSTGLVLAVLIGVNIGPNLTYVGSLATLLWRRILHARDEPPATRDFLRLGILTVPLGILAAVGALWLGLALSG